MCNEVFPYYQSKQITWNPTNHSYEPSTANETNNCYFLIQTAFLRANIKKSLKITFGLFTTPSWQRPQDDDTFASSSPWTATLLGLGSIFRGHIDTHQVNQGLHKPGHCSSSPCEQCVHIINHLQQHRLQSAPSTETILTF